MQYMFQKVINYYIYADKSSSSLIIAYDLSQIPQGVLVPLIPLVPLTLTPQNPYPLSRGRGLGGKGRGTVKIPQGYPCHSLIPSPLLRRKTFFHWPPMTSPLVILLSNLALASLLSLEPFNTSFPTTKPLLLDILPNFLSLINVLFCHKLLLARLPMLLRPPNTSTASSLLQSPQKQSEGSSEKTHSRLW